MVYGILAKEMNFDSWYHLPTFPEPLPTSKEEDSPG